MVLFYIIYNYYIDFVKCFVNKNSVFQRKQEYTKSGYNWSLLSGK